MSRAILLTDDTDPDPHPTPLVLYLGIPDRPIMTIDTETELPPREHFGRDWWAVWARDEIHATAEIQLWACGAHREQAPLDRFAAAYRAGVVEEVWRLLEGHRIRGGQLVDPVVAALLDHARRTRRTLATCDDATRMTKRAWLARARAWLASRPLLAATRTILAFLFDQVEQDAIATGTLDAPIEVPELSPDERRFAGGVISSLLNAEVEHRRLGGGIA